MSLRFIMKNEKGEVLEDIIDRKPVDYLHGSGNILPPLEAAVEGLQTGDRKSIVFNNDTSNTAESYYIDLVIDNVREATPFELQQGKPEPKPSDKTCGPGCCC